MWCHLVANCGIIFCNLWLISQFSKENKKNFLTLFPCKIKSWDGRWTFYRRIYNARRGLSIMSSNKITRRRDVSTLQKLPFLLYFCRSLVYLLHQSHRISYWTQTFQLKCHLVEVNLISESVLVWTHPQKNVTNHYSEHLSLGINSQDSGDLAHFLEDGKTL